MGLAAESSIEGESQPRIFDDEIVCVNAKMKSQSNSLIYRPGTPYFYTFHLLQLNGEDFRSLPLQLASRRG
jgi:hypothetical protein